jgi:hypothetical protein
MWGCFGLMDYLVVRFVQPNVLLWLACLRLSGWAFLGFMSGKLGRALPPWVEAFVLRNLAKDPAQRCQSAAEFARELTHRQPDVASGSLEDSA